ncbi:hypothetical protein CRENBAI_011333 [Crenichthys baileyi]|uniref:Uncharacterized protein n=1 Tax=Crenichthys baileyi TaxID=28760 RepID=A0AAV9RKN1_9TELE
MSSLYTLNEVTLPGALLAPVSSASATRRSSFNSSSSSTSMQTSYRLPNPLPPLPVRKGVRGRRPKSQTIALLKAAAEAAAAAAAANGSPQSPVTETSLVPRPHKKRGPKPKGKKKPLMGQSPGSSPVITPPPETKLNTSHVSVDSNLSNGSNVICTVCSEHGIRYVKLPSASSASSVLRFLENMCQHLESDSLFSSQPFNPYSNNTRFYNRTKSEPLSITENGNENPSKEPTPTPRPLHNTLDYRAAKRERASYPGHTQTPPPLRRVGSNPTELGPVNTHRRVEGGF